MYILELCELLCGYFLDQTVKIITINDHFQIKPSSCSCEPEKHSQKRDSQSELPDGTQKKSWNVVGSLTAVLD